METLFPSLSNNRFFFLLLLLLSSVTMIAQPNCANYTSPLDGANGNGGRTTLTWTAPSTGAAPSSYKLFFGTDGAATNILNGTNQGNVLFYNADNLLCNTTYYWRIVPTNGSGDATGCLTRSFVIAAPGTPAVSTFGNNIWNIYCFTDNNWTTYGGYYTNSSLNFDSRTQWNDQFSPSVTTANIGYLGCQIPVDNFSMSAKRTGFTTGNYQIDVPYSDDQAYLYINGVLVYTKASWGSGPNNVWTGTLNNASTVEYRMTEGGGGASFQIALSTVTGSSSVTPGTISSSQTICPGATAPLTGTTGTSVGTNPCYMNYQWQSSTDNFTFNNIAGATTQNYTTVPLSTITYFRRVDTDACSKTATTNTITISITPFDPGVIATTNTVICSGSAPTAMSSTMDATGGTGGIAYQWQFSFDGSTWSNAGAAGNTNAAFAPTGLITAPLNYRRRATSCSGTSVLFSNIILFTITPVIANNTVAAVQSICSGTAPNALTGLTPTGGTGTYGYLWQSSTTDAVSGFVNAIGTNNTIGYTPGVLTQTTWYRRTVTSGVCSNTSAAIQITVNAVIGSNTANTAQSICTGATPAALTGTAPSGGNGSYGYLWESSIVDASNGFGSATGTNNTAGYIPGVLTQNTWYRRIVTSLNCSNTSAAIQITVNPIIAANTVSAVQSICTSSIPAALTGSTPTGGNGTYGYLWQSSIVDAVSGFANAAGTNNTIGYIPGVLTQTTWYRRTVTSGGCSNTATAIQITVNPVIATNTVNAAQFICTSTAPAALTGSTPTGGTGTYGYLWESSITSAAAGFGSAPGTNNDIGYTPGVLTQTTWFRRTVTSVNCSNTSAAIQITVNPVIANNIITRDQSVCTGQAPLITLGGAVPTGGGIIGTYAYQWESSITSAGTGFTAIGAATAATYVSPSLTQTTWYRRVVSRGGCSNTSAAIQITVYSTAQGNPSVFGNNIWNAYAYSDAAYTTYTGFYTESALSFATTTQFAAGVNASHAPNYQGCAITTGSNVFSTSLKRTNIAPGIYQIDIPAKDDNMSLLINGATVYTGFCCAAATNVWTGSLTAASQVELRWNNTGGNGNLSANFNIVTQPALAAGTIGTNQNLCSGNNPVAFTSTAAATGCSQLAYQWQSSADNITFADISGATALTYDAPAITSTTFYRRSVSDACNSVAFTSSVTVTVNSTIPTPSQEFGNGTWNTYCYQDAAWTAYGGYYTTSALNFDSRTQWNDFQSPSTASAVVPGYLGCQIPVDNFSISAKRTGFTNGIYQIDVPFSDDQAYLYINGILVYTKASAGVGPNNVWTGPLTPASTVEYRMTEGGGGAGLAINIAIVTPATLTGGTIGSDQSICFGNIPAPFTSATAPSGGCYIQSYQWQQSTDGGAIWSDISGSNSSAFTEGRSLIVPTQYRRRATDICGSTALSDVVSVSFSTPPGNPTVFGTNTWNGYAYQDSTWSIYAGFYTEPTLSFNTTSRFTNNQPPSFASGYSGCQIFNTIYSMSFKRQGVPVNGIYQIDITNHDDDVYLYIDGALKFSFIGCCAARNSVWTGNLSSTSQIEFRYKNGVGPGQLQVSLNIVVPGTLIGGSIGTSNTICSGESVTLTNTALASGSCTPNYQWQTSPNGTSSWSDIIGAVATTITTPPLTSTTYYRRQATEPCGGIIAYSNVVTLTLGVTSGNPAIFGSNVWNAYVYGTNTFNSYLGYYVTNAVSFDSYNDWNSNNSPDYPAGGAAGYLGCQVPIDYFSISFKRQGFPVGRYQIDAQHDDIGTLFINGVQVYTAGSIGTYQTNVWTGDLDGSSTVEFRMAENAGGAGARLLFTIVTPSTTVAAGAVAGTQTICNNAIPSTFTSTTLGTSGCYVYYQWQSSPNGTSSWSDIVGATASTYTSTALTANTHFRRNAVNACGVTASTASFLVTVRPTVIAGTISGPAATCSNTAPTFTSSTLATGGDGTYAYQWQSSINNITFNNIGGATAVGLTAPTITANTFYRRGVTSCSQTIFTSSSLVTIAPATAITTQPVNASACSPFGTSYTVAGNGITGFQWQESISMAAFANVTNTGIYTGATAATLNLSNVTGKGTSRYQVIISGTCSPTSITSAIATLSVNAAPIINTQPVNAVICDGANATFSILASGTSLSYRWQEQIGVAAFADITNGGVYSGAFTPTLTLTSPTISLSGRNYRCVVTSGACVVTPINSNAGLLTVNPAIATNTVSATSPVSPVCATVNFTATGSTPTGGAGGTSYNYTWENSTTGLVGSFAPIMGSSINSDAQNITQTTWYRRTVSSGGCTDVSAAFAVVVTPTQAITLAPVATSACSGSSTTFTVTATNAVSYQWQENSVNIPNSGVFSGANTATLTISDVTGKFSTNYRVLVTGCSGTTTSANALLTVPSIITQPANAAVCQGTGTSFTAVAAGGSGYTYQWQVNAGSGFVNLTNFAPYSNVTSATLNISGAATTALNGYLYRVVVNGCANATSNSAVLNVYPQINSNSISASQSICIGSTPTAFTGSTPEGGGPSSDSYQWFSSLDNITFNLIAGATSINFSEGVLNNTTYYIRRAFNAVSGCTNTSTPAIAVTVSPATIVTTQPAVTTNVCTGSNTTISVAAAGQGLGYQWQVDNSGGGVYVDIVNGSPYFNATTSVLSIAPSNSGLNNYRYRAKVFGNCPVGSSVNSNFSTLTVQPTFPVSVSIATSSGGTICANTSVTFTATPSNGGTPAYQWRVNGGNVSGANSATYINTTLANNDQVTVVMTSGITCPTGNPATSNSIATSVNPTGLWLGGTNINWNTTANWCGGVPTSTVDALIPSGTTFQPTINTPGATARNITINSGATLTTTNNLPVNIHGNFLNNGTYVDGGSNVSFLGSSAQAVTNMATAKDLTINNVAGVVLNSNINVSGFLTLTSGALNSNGRLTVNLSTGSVSPAGSGSVVGNMTVRRSGTSFPTADLTSNFHYIGSPLAGVLFTDINDNVSLNSSNFYGYNEGDGNTYIQARWKRLFSGAFAKPLSTVMNSQLFTGGPTAMVGLALKFNLTTPEALDFTGTYTHGTGTSFTTGNMSYTDGGQAWGNGWQLLANPYPSYIDWRLVTTTNLEFGITYYNSTTNNNADYIPPSSPFGESFNNGGSPFIPAMQAYWVQVKPGGNGVVTVPNSARVLSPNFSGYGTVPSFYREARPTAQCFKLVATNANGTDETNIRFGKGATRQFDGKWDIYRTGSNSNVPTLSSQTDGVEYAINSLPEIDATSTVGVNVEIPVSGNYTLSIKDLLNMENFGAVNLYDRKINVSQNLLMNDTYSFTAALGDKKDRFEINFKPSVITNIATANVTSTVNITSNSTNVVTIRASNTRSGVANVIVTNILGQEVYKALSVDVSTGAAEIKIDNASSAIYIVKAIIDGRTYAKEVYLSK